MTANADYGTRAHTRCNPPGLKGCGSEPVIAADVKAGHVLCAWGEHETVSHPPALPPIDGSRATP